MSKSYYSRWLWLKKRGVEKKEKYFFFEKKESPHDKKKGTKTVEKIISGREKGTLTFFGNFWVEKRI